MMGGQLKLGLMLLKSKISTLPNLIEQRMPELGREVSIGLARTFTSREIGVAVVWLVNTSAWSQTQRLLALSENNDGSFFLHLMAFCRSESVEDTHSWIQQASHQELADADSLLDLEIRKRLEASTTEAIGGILLKDFL